MTKQKTIIYSLIMACTFIGEIVFLIVGLANANYWLLIGTGVFFLVQSITGIYMLYEAAFKYSSESTYATMAFGMIIPFGQILSSYFLYRVKKGK